MGLRQPGPTMSDRALVRLARVVALAGGVAAIIATAAFGGFGLWVEYYETWVIHNALVTVGAAAVVWLLIGADPRNRFVWLLVVITALSAMKVAGGLVEAWAASSDRSLSAPDLGPSDLPPIVAVGVLIHATIWIPTAVAAVTLVLLWFPDGRAPGPRWTPVAWFAGVAAAVLLAEAAWTFRPFGTQAYGARPAESMAGLDVVAPFALAGVGLAAVISTASLVARYRSSSGTTRRQIRLVVWAFGVNAMMWVAITVADVALFGVAGGPLFGVGLLVSVPLLLMSFGLALWRHHLFDVDVVITKSITYVGLVAMITMVYVIAVVVAPRVAVSGAGDGPVLPLAATALVAVLFEPARQRLARGAERLVYGRRATPLQVLSQLTARLGASNDDGTDELAHVVATGTGAEQVIVWVVMDGDLVPHGHWSDDGSARPASVATTGLADDPRSITRAVRHGDQTLGAITVTKPRTDPVTPGDVELVEAVAGNAGLVLRHLSLDEQLQERAKEVRASRRRLIAAQDTERHRLERDLHDGAQQHVVALRVKLGIARSMAERDGHKALVPTVEELAAAAQGAVEALRAIAHGIYPPLLETEGLSAALPGLRQPHGVEVSIDVDLPVGGRYPRTVEETIYFCAVETLDRAAEGGAGFIGLTVVATDDGLRFEATHDARSEPVLTAVVDRVDAAEGTVVTGEGRIDVTVPLAMEPAL